LCRPRPESGSPTRRRDAHMDTRSAPTRCSSATRPAPDTVAPHNVDVPQLRHHGVRAAVDYALFGGGWACGRTDLESLVHAPGDVALAVGAEVVEVVDNGPPG
jgi:hypothetical protein